MTSNQQNKRRVRLIQPSLQLRLIGSFAGLTALALIVQVLVLGSTLTSLASSLPSGGAHVGEALPGLLFRCLAISAALVLPALLLIGTRVTFRIAGPLYRMERHLEAVARGERPGACRIRETDQLQSFCVTLNAALERAQSGGEPVEREPADEQRAAA